MPSQPDSHGHFGIFGGRYAAETLMPALLELEAAYRAAEGQGLPRGVRLLSSRIRGEGDAPVRGAEAHRGARRGEDLPQARGHEPHRLPQDQQHPRAGPAGPAHGQEARDRRDRAPASTAWRPPRRRRSSGWSADLHGRGGHPPAGPQRARMRILGAEVVPVTAGTATLKDAMNEAMRDWVTLGPGHLLRHRHRGRPPPLPGDGPRLPERHRPGGEAADPRKGGASPRRPDRLRGRREQRPGALLPLSRRRAVTLIGVEAAGKGSPRGSMRPASRREGSACSTATRPISSRTNTARSGRPTRSRPGSTTPAWGRSTPGFTKTGRARYVTVTDEEAVEAFRTLSRQRGDHPRPGERPRGRPRDQDCADHGEGPDRHHQPLRPGGQGRGDHRRNKNLNPPPPLRKVSSISLSLEGRGSG